MGKWKKNLRIDTEFEYLPRGEGGALPKHRLLCCLSAQNARTHIPHWFVDKHYPEDNGFYYQYFGNAIGDRWAYCPWCSRQIDYDRFRDVEADPLLPRELEKEKEKEKEKDKE